jgi:hypothetical protein
LGGAAIFAARFEKATAGAVAQSVEQRTENPCVAGSIPAHTTALKKASTAMLGFFIVESWVFHH